MVARNVYIVDDDKAVRTSIFHSMIHLGYTVHSLSGGCEFIAEAPRLGSGCVLLSLSMPAQGGIDVIEMLGARIGLFPVIVMTGDRDVGLAVRAMRLGASDVLEKPLATSELLATVARVFDGLDQRAASSGCQLAAQTLVGTLTRREREVLDGLVAGEQNKVIAYRLGLSIRTVEMHRSSMMHRLGVRSLPEALHVVFIAGGTAEPNGRARAPRILMERAA